MMMGIAKACEPGTFVAYLGKPFGDIGALFDLVDQASQAA